MAKTDGMSIEDFLQLVIAKIKDARSKNDWREVARVMRHCGNTLLEKAEEISSEEVTKE